MSTSCGFCKVGGKEEITDWSVDYFCFLFLSGLRQRATLACWGMGLFALLIS